LTKKKGSFNDFLNEKGDIDWKHCCEVNIIKVCDDEEQDWCGSI
jgi:hypothetical protein